MSRFLRRGSNVDISIVVCRDNGTYAEIQGITVVAAKYAPWYTYWFSSFLATVSVSAMGGAADMDFLTAGCD